MECNLLEAWTRVGYGPETAEFGEVRRLIWLPHGVMFGDLILRMEDDLHICMDAFIDHYYLLRWPGWMVAEGALGPPLETKELEALGIDVPVEGWMFACLRSPAMGDAKVPNIAQLVHR